MPDTIKLVPDFKDEEEANVFLSKIRMRAWYTRRWKARYPVRAPLLFAKGVRFATMRSNQRCTTQVEMQHQYMALDPGKANPMEVLHILAHALQPEDGPWHGAEWAQAFLDLVERVYGKDLRRAVKKILLLHRIKTRVVSDESRANYKEAYEKRQGRNAKAAAQKMVAELREMEGQSGNG